jgi:putative ABC transport system permease protein
MKVLGARRGDLLRAVLLEHGLLGIATGLVAAALGSLAAWAVLVWVLKVDWAFLPAPAAAIVGLAVAAVTGLGVAVTRRALATGAAPYLRNE